MADLIPREVKRHLAFQRSLSGSWIKRYSYIFLYYLLYAFVGDARALKALRPLSPAKVKVFLPGGLSLRCSLFDIFIAAKEVLADDIYEKIEDYRPKAGMTVVDIGAQVGSYTLKAASRGASVIAVEPFSESFGLLSLNVSENRLPVRAVNAALSDTEGEAELYLGGESSGSNSLVFARGESQTVRVTTLDSLLAAAGVAGADLLKIDTEGSEFKILKGAEKTLATPGLRIVMELHGEENYREIPAFLERRGFRIDLKTPVYLYARRP